MMTIPDDTSAVKKMASTAEIRFVAFLMEGKCLGIGGLTNSKSRKTSGRENGRPVYVYYFRLWDGDKRTVAMSTGSQRSLLRAPTSKVD
jgi:hypothetical protein